ncbi:MAG TPA: hypothetical protein VFD30_06085 [Terriglobia bacterium]|jgi:hypothetical protein|nr:hypothetical protein [Terriglobia bacterium]
MRARRIALPACALIFAAALAAGEAGPCDPHLLQPAGNPYGYRLRGDRCEGLYVQEVSGAPLVIASWTASFSDFDLGSKRPLRIDWDGPRGSNDVRLRAQSLRRRLYYRMDATRSGGSKSFSWPSDLLAALQIPRKDVGVVGITRGLAGETEQDIYLPLRIGEGGGTARTESYRLVVLPGAELKELFLTLTDFSGGRGRVLKNGAPVGYGYYPAERPIEIPISGVQTRGLYHLEVGATLRGGGASTIELWFYHPGD